MKQVFWGFILENVYISKKKHFDKRDVAPLPLKQRIDEIESVRNNEKITYQMRSMVTYCRNKILGENKQTNLPSAKEHFSSLPSNHADRHHKIL